MKRIISLMLVMIMLLSFGSGVFAEVVSNRSSGIKYEIKMLDGTVLTQEEFIQYLYDNQDKVIEINGGQNNNRLKIEQYNGRPDAITTASYTAPISDGTYYIKGIGEVLIKAGKFIVAGVIVPAGTWLFSKIADFFSGGTGDPNKDIKDGYSLTKIKNNSEANKIARRLGYDGAEALKDDFVFGQGSKFNMYYCTKTYEIVLVAIRDSSVIVSTGLFM